MSISNNSAISTWNCVPEKKSDNKYAIFFVITDNYSFAAANMIMGLYKHSEKLMQETDIVIYHNGISEKNVQLLNQLHDNILYQEVSFPESWRFLIEHPRNELWGPIIIAKLLGFFLIQNYEKALMLDVDMLITGDISELFEIEEAMAWRRVVIWKATELFKKVLKNKDDFVSGPNCGMILFSDKLKAYNFTSDDIPKAFEKVCDLEIEGSNAVNGGNDERVLSWIVYDKGISLKELDIHQYNTTIQNIRPETKLIHFLKYRSAETKPWKNLASYLYFTDWAENYQRWIAMGGEGPVNFSADDYYQLFNFDLRYDLTKKKKEIEKQNKRIKRLEEEVKKIKNSTSWKITKPLRWLAKKLRALKRK